VDYNYIVAEGSSVQIETNDAQLGQSNAAYIDDGIESYDYGNAEKSQRKENIYMSELLKTENIIEGNQLQQQNEQAEDQQQPPEWSINYKTDEANGQIISLSTRELIYWSFQIARGMDYLSSKKVQHIVKKCNYYKVDFEIDDIKYNMVDAVKGYSWRFGSS